MEAADIEGIVIRIVLPKANDKGVLSSEIHLAIYNKILKKQGVIRVRFKGDKASLVNNVAEGEAAFVTFTVFGWDFNDQEKGIRNYSYLHGLNLSV